MSLLKRGEPQDSISGALPSLLQSSVIDFLDREYNDLLEFWTTGSPLSTPTSIQDHCDVVYILYLLSLTGRVHSDAVKHFAELVAACALPGWRRSKGVRPLKVHTCAYIYGTFNLLRASGHGDLYESALADKLFWPEDLVDLDSAVPRYPFYFRHHNWRVSHWLGGIPSLLLSIGRSSSPDSTIADILAHKVLDSIDAKLDPNNGYIKLYRSTILQSIFRLLYGVRHDPTLGDLGGIVHIIWQNQVTGRDSVAAAKLLEQAEREFLRNKPFMEGQPFCLDFDIVYLVRTLANRAVASDVIEQRARGMLEDLNYFLQTSLLPGYSLHKLPGAIATMHECAMLCGLSEIDISVGSTDIIQVAFWL